MFSATVRSPRELCQTCFAYWWTAVCLVLKPSKTVVAFKAMFSDAFNAAHDPETQHSVSDPKIGAYIEKTDIMFCVDKLDDDTVSKLIPLLDVFFNWPSSKVVNSELI